MFIVNITVWKFTRYYIQHYTMDKTFVHKQARILVDPCKSTTQYQVRRSCFQNVTIPYPTTEMYCNIQQIARDLDTSILYTPPESLRTTGKGIAIQVHKKDNSTTFRYLRVKQNKVTTLEHLLVNNNLLIPAYEIINERYRLHIDVDIKPDALDARINTTQPPPFNRRQITKEEVIEILTQCISQVLGRWYNSDSNSYNIQWLDSSYSKKISLHCVVKGAIIHDSYKNKDNLKTFYDLLEYEIKTDGRLRQIPIHMLIDRSMLTNYLFRMPYAIKLDVNIPLIPLVYAQFFDVLLGCWRPEDVNEFANPLHLNERGRQFFANTPNRPLKQLRKPSQIITDESNQTTAEDNILSLEEHAENLDQFTYSVITPGKLIRLDLIEGESYDCPQCNRTHDRDNAYMVDIRGDATIFCFKPTEKKIGKVVGRTRTRNTDIPKRQFSYEYMENIRKNDILMVMPTSLRGININMAPLGDLFTQVVAQNKHRIILRSPLGTGKTIAIVLYILSHPNEKYVIITSRISFAESLYGVLQQHGVHNRIKFGLYRDSEDRLLDKDYSWIIQIDSLQRLQVLHNTTVIIDESESVLKHLENDVTMNTRKKDSVWHVLIELVERSKVTIMLDGHASNRSVEFLRNCGGIEPWMIINTPPITNKIAIRYKNITHLYSKVKTYVTNKEPTFFWFASKKKAEALVEILRLLGAKILFLHDGMTKEEQAKLKNVNEHWLGYDVIICTPVVALGISFEVPNYIHHVMLYVSSASTCMRDAIQAIGRIRKPINTTIEFAMYDKSFLSTKYLPDTIENIQKQLETEALQIVTVANRGNIIVTSLEETHQAIVSTIIYNRLEANASRLYPRQIFEWYLEEAGYLIEDNIEEDDEDFMEETCIILPEKDRIPYKNIPTIPQDISNIREKVNRNVATNIEKSQYDLYCCLSFLGEDAPEELKEKVYDEIWNISRYILYNLREQKRGPLVTKERFREKVAYKSAALVTAIDKTYIKLVTMTNICEKLGIPNTGTRCVISRELIEKLVLPVDLLDVMELRQSRGKKAEDDIQNKVKTLKRVFMAFSGASLEAIRKRCTIDGKVVCTYNYVLEPYISNLWDMLKP